MVCSGVCSQPVSAPPPPTGSCPLSTFALNPAPSQFLWSAPPTAQTNGRAEEACVREGMGWKSLHTSGQHCSNLELQAAAPQTSADHLAFCLLEMLVCSESIQVFLSADPPACLYIYPISSRPFCPYCHYPLSHPSSSVPLFSYQQNLESTDHDLVLGSLTSNL